MREPRDLIALVPYQLGFRPEASAVLVSLRGPRRRVGLVVRVDLADLTHPEHGGQVARDVMAHLAADGAVRAAIVLYREGERAAVDAALVAPLARLREAGEAAFGPMEAWAVGSQGWWAPGCVDAGCCPPAGRDLAEVETAPIRARMVLDGIGFATDRTALGAVVAADRGARKSARGARDRWLARGEAADGPEARYRWRRDGLDAWLGELDRVLAAPAGHPAPTPVVAGRIEAALTDVLVRDAVLLSFVPGTARAQDLVLGGVDDAAVSVALRALVDPEHARSPDPERVRAATEVLTAVVSHAPRDRRAPAETLLAVLAWWSGDGARAGIFVERALARRPGYRLALLVRQVVGDGMPPGWILRDRRRAG